MRRVIARLGKRKAAWQVGTLLDILKSDFRNRDGSWDLSVSVYVVEGPSEEEVHRDLVRIRAEHSVSLLDQPPSGTPNFDVSGLADYAFEPGQTFFRFANERHAALRLQDEKDLKELVAGILADRREREFVVSREAMLEYAAARLRAGDEEWTRATAEGEKGEKWLRRLRSRL